MKTFSEAYYIVAKVLVVVRMFYSARAFQRFLIWCVNSVSCITICITIV